MMYHPARFAIFIMVVTVVSANQTAIAQTATCSGRCEQLSAWSRKPSGDIPRISGVQQDVRDVWNKREGDEFDINGPWRSLIRTTIASEVPRLLETTPLIGAAAEKWREALKDAVEQQLARFALHHLYQKIGTFRRGDPHERTAGAKWRIYRRLTVCSRGAS